MKTFLLVLRVLTLPLLTLFGWLAILIIHAMWGERLFWWEGVLITALKEDSWPFNDKKFLGGWGLSTRTLGDGTKIKVPWGGLTIMPFATMVSQKGMNTTLIQHEYRHTRQAVRRGFMFLFLGLIVGLIGPWWLGLVIWLIGPSSILLVGASTYLEAWTHYVGDQRGRGYYDNIVEQHARGASDDVNYFPMNDVLDGKVDRKDVFKPLRRW